MHTHKFVYIKTFRIVPTAALLSTHDLRNTTCCHNTKLL